MIRGETGNTIASAGNPNWRPPSLDYLIFVDLSIPSESASVACKIHTFHMCKLVGTW